MMDIVRTGGTILIVGIAIAALVIAVAITLA
jgi:hypothetical protein